MQYVEPGKTEMMFETIALALQQQKRVCWAIPRADVVIELVPRLKQAFPYALVIGLHGHSDEKMDYGDIVISTTHQLIRFYQAFDLLIIDEVDAFPYTFDEMLPRLAKKACKPTCATIYLSATPSKADQIAIKKGALKCCLIPARYHLYSLDIPKFQWAGNLEKALKKGRLPNAVLRWMRKKLATNRRALLFVPTIEAGHFLQQVLKKLLKLEVAFVYSNDEERISKVKAFKEETEVTGLVLTKLDGTAKGGVVVGIVEENKIPVKFIGVGEQIDDMEIFNSKDFSKAII